MAQEKIYSIPGEKLYVEIDSFIMNCDYLKKIGQLYKTKKFKFEDRGSDMTVTGKLFFYNYREGIIIMKGNINFQLNGNLIKLSSLTINRGRVISYKQKGKKVEKRI
jgi:hypothetical protein